MSYYQSGSLESLAKEYFELKEEERGLKEQIEAVRKRIVRMMGTVGVGESNYADAGQFRIILSKYESKRLNRKAVEEDYPEILTNDKYSNISVIQTLTIKEK